MRTTLLALALLASISSQEIRYVDFQMITYLTGDIRRSVSAPIVLVESSRTSPGHHVRPPREP